MLLYCTPIPVVAVKGSLRGWPKATNHLLETAGHISQLRMIPISQEYSKSDLPLPRCDRMTVFCQREGAGVGSVKPPALADRGGERGRGTSAPSFPSSIDLRTVVETLSTLRMRQVSFTGRRFITPKNSTGEYSCNPAVCTTCPNDRMA